MPRSSRSKSHKQSKHSVKEAVAAKEYTDSEEDVLKMKARNGKEDSASVRVSRDSASGEKRKFASSQLKDDKDLSGFGNGDALEDYVSFKRRKEKESDRWSGGGGDERVEGGNVEKEFDKVLKSKDSKSGVVEVKSKSSGRRHESGSEKKEETVSVIGEKEESKGGGSRSESKRKAEKDSGRKDGHQYKDSKETKEKDRGSDRERKTLDGKRDAEGRAVGGEVARKQGEDQQNKKGRENAEFPVEDGVRNPELEKELEKRIRRRGESSVEKDKYQDDLRESDDKRVSARVDRSKDARHKDERLKEESYSDKYKEDGDQENRHRQEKYREDGERDNRHRDAKYREDGDRDNRHREDKYREDGDRDYRHREDKYREDGNRDSRHKEDKYREDVDRDSRRRDDKYREVGERNDRNRDDKHREDADRDYRHKEEKYREDIDRDSKHRDGRPRDDVDREKRARDAKYKDVHTSRDRPSDPETKRFKDDGNVADLYFRKSLNRDTSPLYDDRVNRYKDDKDRRGNDKEDPSDSRSRSIKEQRPDSEKRSIVSAKVDPVTDRGRANSRNTDLDAVVNNSRRRSSPGSSSYSARDHYRVSKQEELKYRDYAFDERVRHNVPSSRDFVSTPGQTERLASSRSLEKAFQKDDSHLAELPLERRPRSDARASPLQLVDKSPSSTSNDRRNLNRSDVRRNLDLEEPGQRSSGSKDVRDYSGKGNRELPIENPPTDEFSQADGDNLSISSPYTRNSHFPGNSKSLLPPPPPFRGGPDSPSVFGSAEDERGNNKSNNRHRRMSDSNMGRPQNAWKGVPNWPSPMPNGYMPFQHGPPPFGVHPVMQQFPPPMFGVRPTMDLGHNGLPYHMPDGDRFSAHGRPMHGWDANNAAFGDEHIFGRLDWDRNRNPMGNRGWESSNDMWKGQNSLISMDMQSTPQREDYSARRPAEETLTSQSGQPIENEQNQLDFQAESIDISQSSDTLDGKTPEAPKITAESPIIYETSKEEESRVCQIYLSKIDISEDLTQPDLYSQCSDMMDLDQTTPSEELDYKILYIEDSVESRGKIPDKTPSDVLFTAINESVFKKAMSLYKKQKEEYGTSNGDKLTLPNVEGLELDQQNAGSGDGLHVVKANSPDNGKLPEEAEGAVIDCIVEKAEQTVPTVVKPEPNLTTNMLMSDDVIVEVDPHLVKNEPDSMVEEKSSAVEAVEQSGDCFPVKGEKVNSHDNSEEDIRLVDSKCGGDVSSTEAMMPESIECGSVNLSRIHHSPESTH